MKTRFLHTADWQIGKPFGGIADPAKRALAQKCRIDAVSRLGELARDEKLEFILVAGDLFDSPSVGKATVSALCSAVGKIGIPVIAIPGNHDPGGPACLWEHPFFRREAQSLAPNLTVLLEPKPFLLATAVIFPCPLQRRSMALDPLSWLSRDILGSAEFGQRARIILAHGSTQDFGAAADEEDVLSSVSNLLDVSRLPLQEVDYVALGDWHGTKQINAKTWYSGTPELDRFPKGEGNDPGHCLSVTASRGEVPSVEKRRTALLRWHSLQFEFIDGTSQERFERLLSERLSTRAQEDLLRLELSGMLSIADSMRLEQTLEAIEARLLRLKLVDGTRIQPSTTEIEALLQRDGDPLISRVARRLLQLAGAGDSQAEVARVALRELHAACTSS